MPDPLSPDEELRRLREFVGQLQQLLQGVALRPVGIINGRHHELMTAAWIEVSKHFIELVNSLNANARPKLEHVGLVGFRLQFELSLFAEARSQLLDHAPNFVASASSTSSDRPEASRKRSWRQRFRRLLGRCLSVGDVILGSLATAFPPAEIIKQFKEGVEEGISLARMDRKS